MKFSPWIDIACKLLIGFCLSICTSLAHAQSKKELTIVVPFGDIAETTITAKRFSAVLAKHLPDLDIVIKTMPENEGIDAHKYVIKAPKDGKTLLFSSTVDLLFKSLMNENIEPDYDQFDFVDVIFIQPMICVTTPDSPYRDYRVFFKTLKENPKSIRHVVYTQRNTIFASFFMRILGVKYRDLTQVIARKGKTVIDEVVEGRADFYCATSSYLADKLLSGRVVPIFTNSVRGIDGLPEIPVAGKIGLKAIEPYRYWNILCAPKGTPAKEIIKLRLALVKALDDPDWKALPDSKFGSLGIKKIENIQKYVSEQYSFFENIVVLSKLNK